ncbi:ABC transporter substrate-binding protein [Amycolatopsis sp. 195334CR]|uniref:ABC transporter substrate-binding protein n=1 Tax=Amycolatopsis sp. 195334CR TaxID=2814588 RepID=UPI001A8D590F|nr:ABC transporter substrate-binding protein [Amycolatopsis sp. 195334CR]MBN6042197.1 carbohydrate ABC transporter substrate-binding protein [Amycolatopsis sp. 195334CR]
MKLRSRTLVLATAGLIAFSGCSASGDAGADGRIDGEITVLTQRTDLVDTVFEQYKREFAKVHPEVKVTFQGITDYEGEVKIRMSSQDYGDVLLIPESITREQLPSYFEPLGDAGELAKKYRFIPEQTHEGKAYGLAITGNAFGFVYNKRIWQQAGITAPPRTPAQFLDALRAIKDKTDAIPLYTNYRNGWPLAQWEDLRASVAGQPDVITTMAAADAPWTPGTPQETIDTLLFDAVAGKLTEEDPTTTDWETSKKAIGEGKIATMMLGSWALTQVRELAATPDDLGYLPFPSQVGGRFHSAIAGDYKNAVSVHSRNKDAARAWVDWFADQSGYAASQGGFTPLLGGPDPAILDEFTSHGVTYFELDRSREPVAKMIDKTAEIGLYQPTYRQTLIDAARGANGQSKQDVFDDLNRRWAEARSQVTS